LRRSVVRLTWAIGKRDVQKVKDFYARYKSTTFVQERLRWNVTQRPLRIRRDTFWRTMVMCLLTTQQRSGPGSHVSRFMDTRPFPLTWGNSSDARDVERLAQKALRSARGVRRTDRIAAEIAFNFRVVHDEWPPLRTGLASLLGKPTPQQERAVARTLTNELKGIGPKQSRNLLQLLGLTRHEIPLDSRITKWLNQFPFPVHLNAKALADEDYYSFILDGVQDLCRRSSILPCLLDAAIFVSFQQD